MVTGIDEAHFDRPAVILGIGAVCGFVLALAVAFTRSRWVVWSSLLLSIPAACWNFIWLFMVVSLLRATLGIFSGAHPQALLGRPAFQWFSLFVTLLMISMPVLWGATCYRLYRRLGPNQSLQPTAGRHDESP